MSHKKLNLTNFLVSLLMFVLIPFTMMVYANPADPFPHDVNQADGTQITIRNFGDEFFNWRESSDGYVIAYDENTRNWTYAYISNNEILPSNNIVGSDSVSRSLKITREDLTDLMNDAQRSVQEAHIAVDAHGSIRNDSSQSTIPPITHTKNRQPLLVLLIEYNDRKFSTEYTDDINDYWSNHHFGTSGKTVNTYYEEISGEFNLQFTKPEFTEDDGFSIENPIDGVSLVLIKDGVARVTLDRNHPNTTNFGGQVANDISLAFDAVKEYIDFSNFPTHNNTILSEDFNVTSVLAGYDGSSNQSQAPRIWAHASMRYWYNVNGKERNFSVDFRNDPSGKSATYATQGELYNSTTPMPIGVTVHELGHVLGLPDLYSYIQGEGIGAYSLMAGGSWGTDRTTDSEDTRQGNTPTHMDAWSKARLGFVSPEVFTHTDYTIIDVSSFAEGYNVLKITNVDLDPSQHFLVENRQSIGFDKGLSGLNVDGSGILIFHIDERVYNGYQSVNSVWTGRPNDNNYHKAVDLEKFPSNAFFVFGESFDAESTPNSNFHEAGHTLNPSPSIHLDCHPQTLPSGIQIRINSDSSHSMEVEIGEFVAVTNITGVATTANAGTPLELTATIEPNEVSKRTINWSVIDAGTTGATITGDNILNVTAAGTLEIRATIPNGATESTDYIQDFTIISIGAIDVQWLDLIANGESSITDTDQLTLIFDDEVIGLTADHIRVIGATKVDLTGSSTTWTLDISDITVNDGESINVSIDNLTGFYITPNGRDVVIHKIPTDDASLIKIADENPPEWSASSGERYKIGLLHVPNTITSISPDDIIVATGATLEFFGTDDGFYTQTTDPVYFEVGVPKNLYFTITSNDETVKIFYDVTIIRADVAATRTLDVNIAIPEDATTFGKPMTATFAIVVSRSE